MNQLIRWTAILMLTAAAHGAPEGADAVRLAVQWPLGRQYVQMLTTQQRSSMESDRFPAPIVQDLTQQIRLSATVTREMPDGGRTVSVKILSSKLDLSTGGETQSYDSNARSDDDPRPLASMLRRLTGATFIMQLDTAGKPVAFDGFDAFMSGFAGDDPQARELVEKMFGAQSMKLVLTRNLSCSWLPEQPVAPGSSWHHEERVDSGALGELVARYDYRFAGWEERDALRCAKILFSGAVLSTDRNAPSEEGRALDLEQVEIAGTAWFDPEQGQLRESSMSQKMTLALTVRRPAEDGGPFVIRTHVEQQTTLRLEQQAQLNIPSR